jgi:hypothetical protein
MSEDEMVEDILRILRTTDNDGRSLIREVIRSFAAPIWDDAYRTGYNEGYNGLFWGETDNPYA